MTGIEFTATVWKYPGASASWYFVTLTKAAKGAVDEAVPKRRGWGQVPVETRIGSSTWRTSVFPDKKLGYVLPVKASIRTKENIDEGDKVRVTMKIKPR